MPEYPESVRIREVGPRDGFQNEPELIPTEQKLRLIGMLADAGLGRIEVGSFVRADVIPQLADTAEGLEGIERRAGLSYSVLVPNERGLERALAHRDRFDEVSVFLSASETHNLKNVNRSIAESLIVMLSVPFAMIGVTLGLLLTGQPFGFGLDIAVVEIDGSTQRRQTFEVQVDRARADRFKADSRSPSPAYVPLHA